MTSWHCSGVAHFPDEFGMHLPADVRRQVEPLLESLLEANQELDRLLSDIEKQMRATDPKRQPVNQFQGRKFEIDQKKGTMTYLDEPDRPVPLNLAVVHTKDQPATGRQAPVRSKDREKGPER